MPGNMSPMPPMQSMNQSGSGHHKASAPLIILATVVLVLIVWWVSRAPQPEQALVPTATPTPVAQDEIQTEANLMDLGNIDTEFKDIEAELNTL